MRAILAGVVAASAVVWAGAAGADARFETRDPGPFGLPADWEDLLGGFTPCDLDPAAGSMEDYTGWYGTEEEAGHAFDGAAGTYFAVHSETDVLAAADGVVVELADGVPPGDPNASNYVMLDHGDGDGEFTGYASRYDELAIGVSDVVQVDDVVVEGDVIGASGGLGSELGPHLAFYTYLDGVGGCPFVEGWWRRGLQFLQGVYQYQDAPLYIDADTSSDVMGHQKTGTAYVGTMRIKNPDATGFYRYWLPADWGTVVEALDRFGDLEHPDDYFETGDWVSVASGSQAPHVLGSYARGTDAAGSATFVPRIVTPGDYEVLATWGASANASDVRYSVVHADGHDTVSVTQRGGGLGTFEEPRVITEAPYVDRDDTRVSGSYYLFGYDCADSPEDEGGQEVIYRLETSSEGSVQLDLAVDEDADVDVFLLDALQEDACLAWADESLDLPLLAAGTYYVVVDTPGLHGQSSPGGYELTVRYDGAPAGDSATEADNAHVWTSLGTFRFDEGKDPELGAVSVEVVGDEQPVVGNPVRVVADAVQLRRVDRAFYAYGEGGQDSPIAEDVLVLKEFAMLGVVSAESWPVMSAPFDDEPVLFRARRGQRFLSDVNYDGWYEIRMPGLAGEVGYLHEDGCVVWHRLPPTDIDEWNPPGDDDDEDDDTAGDDDDSAGDDDGCECRVAPAPTSPRPALVSALLTGLALWLLRRRR